VNTKILVRQIIGLAAAGSAGYVPKIIFKMASKY